MLEKTIEKQVCDYAKQKGWLVYKFVSPGQRGVPDRIFLREGSCFFIEFKATGKKPSKLQWRKINELRDIGFDVYVIDKVHEGKIIVDAI
jgi:Holliday junction resolvase|tara:strand:+ start:8092 stop:8361 length:270 start_codon:yes stop_codon:yes gene_type:complete